MASHLVSKFHGQNFYDVLGLPKNASEQDIRRAYRSLAFKVHPDKCGNDEQSTRDFAHLGKIMEVLCDPVKRKAYDRTGSADDVSSDFDEMYDFGRSKFNEVTVQDIDEFERRYKGSDEEKADLLAFYTQMKGDMKKVMEWVPLSTSKDVDRFADIIRAAVCSGAVKGFAKFEKSLSTLNIDDNSEAAEAEELKKELGLSSKFGKSNGDSDLKALILQRQKQRGASFLSDLEAKYAPTKPKKGQQPQEMSEDDFLKIQQGLDARKRGGASASARDQTAPKRPRQKENSPRRHGK